MKLFFFDTETTGLDPQNAAIIQIAGMMDRLDENMNVLEHSSINILMHPHVGAEINADALRVNGISMDELYSKDRLPPGDGYRALLRFCKFPSRVFQPDRIHACGYNIMGFDIPFLYALGKRSGDPYCHGKFHWPGIDVAALAAFQLMRKRQSLPNFKLMTVAKYMGVNTEGQAHDALFDVAVTRELFYKIIGASGAVPQESTCADA